jgi:small GTP-binding protein
VSVLTGLGKSSLTVQFVENHFVESYYPTIENTFSKTIKYRGQEYTTEIIDTAGQVYRHETEYIDNRMNTVF